MENKKTRLAMKESFYITVCFENPALNFSSSSGGSTKEEIKEDLIGSAFDFQFRNGGIVNCIDVIFSEE